LRIGIIGLHNKGRSHLRDLQLLPGVRVAALCDLDPQVLAPVVAELKGRQITPFATTDARELLARPDVDAVVIVTGNHWHALLTLWACQAGKDVYVEKPMSHTVWEGRKMIEMARKYGRVVEVGMQYRSDTGLREAAEFLRQGHCGRLQHVHVPVYMLRKDIGRRQPWYPDWLNYDLFCGPAPMAPLERTRLHYDWHWTWGTGNGDLGNNGVHVLDIALLFAGQKALPRRILSVGARYGVADGADTPNTMLTVYDYPDVPFIFDHRSLPAKPGMSYTDDAHGVRTGVVVRCEGGYFAGLKGGAVYDNQDKLIKKFPGDGGKAHMATFLAAVRSRRAGDLAAGVEIGHTGAALCHYGNISYRIGEPGRLDRVRKALEVVPAAGRYLDGLQRHLGVHGIDLDRHPFTLGQWIQVEGDNIAQVESGRETALERARFLLRETQRPPYVIPENI